MGFTMSDIRHRTFETLGILMNFRAFPGETDGKFCLVEAVVPPGLGAPPNHHAGETEAFYVLDGEVTFTIGDAAQVVHGGGYVAIPDGAVHAFTVTGPDSARMLILNAPGHMHEAFFTALGRPVPADTGHPAPMDGPPDIPAVMAAAGAVGMTILAPAEA